MNLAVGFEAAEELISGWWLLPWLEIPSWRKSRYYFDEVKEKCGKDLNVSLWEREYVMDLPKQENGFDCGVFMVKYADFYSRDIGLCFNQQHMPYFRRRIAKEILKLRAE